MATQTEIPIYEMPTQQLAVLSVHKKTIAPALWLLAMIGGIFFVDAVLPLRGLWFYDIFLGTRFGQWLLLPTRLLFPGYDVVFFKANYHVKLPETLAVSWQETYFLLASFVVLFLCYIGALRFLPRLISYRFLLLSTLLLGAFFLLFPVATSQDVYSYIIYARMGAIYHLNPLTTLPTVIKHDVIYPRIYWINQPSAYGPTWAIITSSLQWLALRIGLTNPVSMVLLLRLFSLAMHLGSTQLIWSISGKVQQLTGNISQRQRLLATLAFAWNPLLLFEASVNAHNDTAMLFFVLLATWALLPRPHSRLLTYGVAATLLAIAVCLKITLLILAPGLFLYILTQRSYRIRGLLVAALAFMGTFVLLYAPFWQHGAVLHILQLNPGVAHTINTPYEFLIRLDSSLKRVYVAPATYTTGSPIEVLAHQISIALFIIGYLICSLSYLFSWRHINAQNSFTMFLRWMTAIWFLYSFIGTPWFWPWYMITFFGLYALIEATTCPHQRFLSFIETTIAVRVLAFSLLSVYCFLTIGLLKSYIPGLYRFQWSYLAGLWIWLLPLLVIYLKRRHV